MGDAELEACLKGCDLVVIPAGVPRKPGMTRDDLFNINAGIVMNLVTAAAKYCPNVRRGVSQLGCSKQGSELTAAARVPLQRNACMHA